MSGDAAVNLVTAVIDASGKYVDYVERKEAVRKIGNLEKEVKEQTWLLEGKIGKVSSTLEHYADI